MSRLLLQWELPVCLQMVYLQSIRCIQRTIIGVLLVDFLMIVEFLISNPRKMKPASITNCPSDPTGYQMGKNRTKTRQNETRPSLFVLNAPIVHVRRSYITQ